MARVVHPEHRGARRRTVDSDTDVLPEQEQDRVQAHGLDRRHPHGLRRQHWAVDEYRRYHCLDLRTCCSAAAVEFDFAHMRGVQGVVMPRNLIYSAVLVVTTKSKTTVSSSLHRLTLSPVYANSLLAVYVPYSALPRAPR